MLLPKKFKPKVYIKDESRNPIYNPVSKVFLLRTKGYPVFLMFFGIFIAMWQLVWPLVSFTTYAEQSSIAQNSALGIVSGFRKFEFGELEEKFLSPVSSKQLSAGVSVTQKTDSQVLGEAITNIPKTFYLTVPKLDIEKALVVTNSPDLSPDDHVGHYPGSSLPGEEGNVFLYGHSVLPFFYNPSNYKTIFSTIDKLESGDEFILTYNNKDFKYIVKDKIEKKPEEVNPLAKFSTDKFNTSTAVLMTCSPPGTKLRRLMVTAELVN